MVWDKLDVVGVGVSGDGYGVNGTVPRLGQDSLEDSLRAAFKGKLLHEEWVEG